MKIEGIKIKNYKFIKELEIEQMENACILIGRNSTGKTMILDAIMTGHMKQYTFWMKIMFLKPRTKILLIG